MSKPSGTHVLCKLRQTIGMSQAEFAELLGVSKSTIVAIEAPSGRLRLSHRLAQLIQDETDVSVDWLLANDLKAPMVDAGGDPYTAGSFEAARPRPETYADWGPTDDAESFVVLFYLMLLEATRRGKGDRFASRAIYKLREAAFGILPADWADKHAEEIGQAYGRCLDRVRGGKPFDLAEYRPLIRDALAEYAAFYAKGNASQAEAPGPGRRVKRGRKSI